MREDPYNLSSLRSDDSSIKQTPSNSTHTLPLSSCMPASRFPAPLPRSTASNRPRTEYPPDSAPTTIAISLILGTFAHPTLGEVLSLTGHRSASTASTDSNLIDQHKDMSDRYIKINESVFELKIAPADPNNLAEKALIYASRDGEECRCGAGFGVLVPESPCQAAHQACFHALSKAKEKKEREIQFIKDRLTAAASGEWKDAPGKLTVPLGVLR